MEQLIYHYTTSENARKIIASKSIKVSEWERINKVKPAALWLSLNPNWENTATKSVWDIKTGEIKSLSFEEQYESFGCTRFILPFNTKELCSWAKYKYVTNTPVSVYENMEHIGLVLGAYPKEWFASFKDIPLSKVIGFEIWNGFQWVNKDHILVGTVKPIEPDLFSLYSPALSIAI